jgi:SAM-dependent methyltransferase
MKKFVISTLRKTGLLQLTMDCYQAARITQFGEVFHWVGRRRHPDHDGSPLPGLIRRVSAAGTADVDWFLKSGRLGSQNIVACLRDQGRSIAEIAAILDFGCGCGRVIRHWRDLVGTRVCGTDANGWSIRWCRRNLRFAHFEKNRLTPPLAYEAAPFDLVYALSVFSHMPEELCLAWRDELRRVLKPGGYLLITTHGESYLDTLTPAQRATFSSGRLVVRSDEAPGTNLCGAYHPVSYVRQELGVGFEHVVHIPEGAGGNPHQDVHLLRKVGNS